MEDEFDVKEKKNKQMFDELVEKFFDEFLEQSNIKKKEQLVQRELSYDRVKIFRITAEDRDKKRFYCFYSSVETQSRKLYSLFWKRNRDLYIVLINVVVTWVEINTWVNSMAVSSSNEFLFRGER